jgi:hypothetical protein
MNEARAGRLEAARTATIDEDIVRMHEEAKVWTLHHVLGYYWWTLDSNNSQMPIPSNGSSTTLKQFTERVLRQGQYDELEKIKTPKPGEQFDMNQLAVAGVLTINKAVEIILELMERVTALEEAAVQAASQQVPANEPFKLKKIGDSYTDVRGSA